MVTRTKPVNVGGSSEWRAAWKTQPWSPWTQRYNTKSVRTNSVLLGADVPAWRDKIKLGRSATTTLSGVRNSWEAKEDHMLLYKKYKYEHLSPSQSYLEESRGNLIVPQLAADPDALVTTKADNIAMMKFVERCKAEQQSMQGGVFIGEIREALHMIRSPFKSLRKGMVNHFSAVGARASAMRRGKKLPTVAQTRRMVADSYLEVMFGWRPLLADMDDGMRALAALSREIPSRKTVSARGKDERLIPGSNNQISDYNGLKVGWVSWSEQGVDIRYHGAVTVRAPSALEQFGIGMSEVALTAWELIPWSFVADYFSNMQEIITAATFNSSSITWAEKGIRKRNTNYVSYAPAGVRPPDLSYEYIALSTCNGGLNKSSFERVERVNWTGLSLVPSLEFQIPGLSMKWLNLAALGASHRKASAHVYRPYRR